MPSSCSTRLPLAARFPSGFGWGFAASAYQIEGAAAEDGRGPSDLGHVRSRAGRDRRRPDAATSRATTTTGYAGGRRGSWPTSARRPTASASAGRACSPRAPARSTSPASTSTIASSMPCWPPASSRSINLFHWDLPQALQDRGGFADPAGRRLVHRLRRAASRRTAGRSGHRLDDVQRAGGVRLPRPCRRDPCAGAARLADGAARRRQPAPRPRRGGRRPSARRSGTRGSASPST